MGAGATFLSGCCAEKLHRVSGRKTQGDQLMGMGATTPAVELRHVSKNYGRVQALKDFSLTVVPGEVVAVLGPNGAGKSTAIALMLGLRRSSSGNVLLFGENPRLANHRKRIGVMLQESGVPETLTVRELVELFG